MSDGIFDNNQYLICETCIERLKESYSFRCQIEDSQTRLKNVYSKSDFGKILSAEDFKISDGKENMFTCDFQSDDDIDPNFALIEIASKVKVIKESKPRNKIIIRSKNCKAAKKDHADLKIISKKKTAPIKEEEEDSKLTSENAYDVAVQNLLNPDDAKSAERRRNNLKIMSESESKDYRRLYYRLRYAKSIPFKLDETALNCTLCSETFPTHKNLVSHMAIHYPNHICDLCGKSFVLKEQLAGHIRTHSTEKISCKICNKFLKKSSMRRHIRTHSGNSGVYACPSCPERFVSFNTRVHHMAEVHGIDIFKYICSICSKKFHLSTSLSKHIRRCHFQELNVSCPECGKGFFDKKTLKNHMLKHTGEKKFQCEICNKSYMRKCSINEHMKIHNNIRQHVCTVCDKAFRQKCTLKNHMKTHEKLKIKMEGI